MKPTTVAVLQFNPQIGEVEKNLAHVEAMLKGVDADLIVLPELFASGYFFESTEQAHALSESATEGPTVARMTQWAQQTGATLVGGLPERDADRYYNSAVVVTPRGWLGTYRKTHLFYEETLHFTPGDTGFQVWTVTDRNNRSYRLGAMVCFDWFFPESARTLALRGADVIAHPSNLVLQHCPRSMPIRALENHVFTATANRTGTESNGRETLEFIGQSLICSPGAKTLASARGQEEGIFTAQIDPRSARQRQINPHNDLLGDRRPETYAS